MRCLADPQSVCAAAADEFVHSYRSAVEAHGVFRVALSGGSTPGRLHRLLTQSPYREKVCWERVVFFFGDERAVHPDHPDSNYRMARDTLFSELGIAQSRVHRMHAEQRNLDRASLDYEAQIADRFGVEPAGPPPRFDLILLGMGADGHTASLFPETSALLEAERWVVGNRVSQLDCSRMTFTYPLINRAQRVVFLIPGEAKAPALVEVLEGPHDPTRYPSQAVRPDPGSLLYIVDRAAAGLLRPETRQLCERDGTTEAP
ncbi:MAG: 6-phosphogluconolactonase [bacterium]|nr:6-phosphogluconolactonase [bacterium]